MTRSARRVVLVAALTGGIIVGAAGAPAALAQEDTQPPAPPTNLRVVSKTTHTTVLAVDPAKDNVAVSVYWIHVNGERFWHYTSDPSHLWVGELEPATNSTFTVTAVDTSGNESAHSQPLTASTNTWNAPANLRATNQPGGSVQLSWGSANEGEVASRFDILDGDRLETLVHDDTATSATIQHLAPGTHTIEVRARCYCSAVASSRVTVTIPDRADRTPPSAPANVRTIIGRDGVPVGWAWDPSTDNVDPSSAITYDVLARDQASGQLNVVKYGIASTSTVEAAQFVRAADSSGNVSALTALPLR